LLFDLEQQVVRCSAIIGLLGSFNLNCSTGAFLHQLLIERDRLLASSGFSSAGSLGVTVWDEEHHNRGLLACSQVGLLVLLVHDVETLPLQLNNVSLF